MKTTGKSAASPSEARSRLWMLAVVGILFSFSWPLIGALTHQYSFAWHSTQTSFAAHSLASTDVVGRNVLRMMPVTMHGIRHTRSSFAAPVGFHVADLNIPRNSERVFSYRKIDEFLQHQVRLSDGADGARESFDRMESLRTMDISEQVDDVQVF